MSSPRGGVVAATSALQPERDNGGTALVYHGGANPQPHASRIDTITSDFDRRMLPTTSEMTVDTVDVVLVAVGDQQTAQCLGATGPDSLDTVRPAASDPLRPHPRDLGVAPHACGDVIRANSGPCATREISFAASLPRLLTGGNLRSLCSDMKNTGSTKVSKSTSGTRSGSTGTRSSSKSICRSLPSSVRLLTTFDSPELLRGTDYKDVLTGFGHILRNNEGSADTFSLSTRVDQISTFVSHNWSVSSVTKFMCLALHFNVQFALTGTLLVGILVGAATGYGLLPLIDFAGSPPGHNKGIVASILCPLVFWLLLFSKHEIYRLLGIEGDRVFLDKTCIHQTDMELKRKGIESLSAFIRRSERIVVVYGDEYLQKLWTVYELATFLVLYPDTPIVLLPVRLPWVLLIGSLSLTAQSMLQFGTRTKNDEIGRLISYLLPLVLMAFHTRQRTRSLVKMQKLVDNFKLEHTKCFCEDDRPLVRRNIVMFLKYCELATEDMLDEEVVEIFDAHVRATFGRVIRDATGPTGTPYRWILVFVAVGAGGGFVDYNCALAAYHTDVRDRILTFIASLSFRVAGMPLLWAVLCQFSSVSLHSKGVVKWLIVLFAAVAGGGLGQLLFSEANKLLEPWAKDEASYAGLIAFTSYHFGCFLVSLSLCTGYDRAGAGARV
eukprot:TRINITY_DN24048_c0_g1_i1.p1 TRINITY_DN24048_c0_g1~~TRINITY_DN24048_c0_g1_i1.p1  ORF type:complete len:666 (+),score=46.75 TRINITY_DN24048_c0_g1_i1:192-2189(+)